MEKFLKIPILGKNDQLISSTDIILIKQFDGEKSAIYYKSGTGTDLLEFAYDYVAGVSENMGIAISEAVISSLQTSWQNVVYQVKNLPVPIIDISVG